VNRLGDRPATAERARWLAELAQAIGEAQRVARSLSASRGHCPESALLHAQLELVRIEVEELRRGGWGARPIRIDPHRTNLVPW
jgi:hypothetical protein